MSSHQTKTIWQADQVYSNHRIPGMLITQRGTLLLYREARRDESTKAKPEQFARAWLLHQAPLVLR